MLVLTMISSDCRLPGHSLQLDRELQSASHQLAHAPYKQILSLATEDELGRLFEDCELGAIPPIGAAYEVPVILDESVCGATDLF